jgi:hypothetical protein
MAEKNFKRVPHDSSTPSPARLKRQLRHLAARGRGYGYLFAWGVPARDLRSAGQEDMSFGCQPGFTRDNPMPFEVGQGASVRKTC